MSTCLLSMWQIRALWALSVVRRQSVVDMKVSERKYLYGPYSPIGTYGSINSH